MICWKLVLSPHLGLLALYLDFRWREGLRPRAFAQMASSIAATIYDKECCKVLSQGNIMKRKNMRGDERIKYCVVI